VLSAGAAVKVGSFVITKLVPGATCEGLPEGVISVGEPFTLFTPDATPEATPEAAPDATPDATPDVPAEVVFAFTLSVGELLAFLTLLVLLLLPFFFSALLKLLPAPFLGDTRPLIPVLFPPLPRLELLPLAFRGDARLPALLPDPAPVGDARCPLPPIPLGDCLDDEAAECPAVPALGDLMPGTGFLPATVVFLAPLVSVVAVGEDLLVVVVGVTVVAAAGAVVLLASTGDDFDVASAGEDFAAI
jgi:hypothetical protein